jgi:malate dehydrogenase (oxaloacetate-decarboxylating)(NADP+)
VVVAAGLINALEIQSKKLEEVKIVFLGAGAAGCSCARLLKSMGARNIIMVDRQGVLDKNRSNLHEINIDLAIEPSAIKTLDDAMQDADVFIGVSAANALSPSLVKKMQIKPIIFALANPDPEILPHLAHAERDDLVMATGRSDFPNQVNNALCFPYLFRGALDAKAKEITESMKIAAAKALAKLAKEPVPQEVLDAYGLNHLVFGKDYIIPKPLDKRLMTFVSNEVAKAASK